MRARVFPTFLLLLSCSTMNRVSDKIEDSHRALYKQKALFVYEVRLRKVYLVNPTQTRCYYLQGREFAKKWAPGDTMIIDQHLDDFYQLKFLKKCNL